MARYLVALRKETTYAEWVAANSPAEAADLATVLVENDGAKETGSEVKVIHVIARA